ncbi:MAG: hypothetical protein J5741_00310 [Bacteroidales bacterium]|nr:hypothetical protein [Bacteroidales bacterium]
MGEDIDKSTVSTNAPAPARKPSRAWLWVLLAAVVVALILGVLRISQQRKETYEYHFTVQTDTLNKAAVGLEEIIITHRWTPMGGLFPKVVLHGVAKVDGADVKYGQFVFMTDKDPVPTIVDPTRRKEGHYWVTLRDIPEGRIVNCRFVVMTKDGRKISSDPYIFNTKRETE